MKLVQDLGTKRINGKMIRFGIYECPICLTTFETKTANVLSKRSTKCKSCATRISSTTHGESKTSRIYKIHESMKARCNNSNHTNYPNYGGRGITICDEWNNYENFREWAVSNGYSENLTLDRKNNNENYTPDNCRWANKYVQAANKRKGKGKHKYIGVRLHKGGLYEAIIGVNKKQISIGYFKKEDEAKDERNNYIRRNNLPHTIQ